MDKIDKDIMIGELVEAHPESIDVMQKHGLHCIGCHVATWETLEQGAQGHGIDIKPLVEDINKAINKK